ncbi:SDR family NAD(P)-dependent oxidoreductase [Anthocerotibacter panamensis]|uniref:SDR family NAD(P)-dependent oxidoreductase n=1 Tax=Anthocerotibacter panamensis TaxID=2857077 RepID=UPI001C405D44|nr:SDR family NAD(P)-dependent oxidoreductase [Anthocerotibacter panamensis]
MKNTIEAADVFLVSGGAKGITAKSVVKLAESHRCKFILLGRSSIAEPEPEWAKSWGSEAEVKKKILEHLNAQGEKPTPAKIQQEYQALVSRREIEQTLQAIEQAGGQAEYLSVDVTDGEKLQAQVASAVERLGRITGIIHGAGNLADKRIERKTAGDFEKVYAPKIKGLSNLLRCVAIHELDYLILFSSVVGFYGNAGQTDYALANEVLNKTAHLIKQNYPDCHVTAIDWGGWDSGMVTPEIKKSLNGRNIELIPMDIGTRMLVDELNPEKRNASQVVIGSPLFPAPAEIRPKLEQYHIHRKLTVAANPFLQDHVIGGYPVLPATCAIAWILNSCEQFYPGYTAFICNDFKILKGIPFDETLAGVYILDLCEVAKNSVSGIVFDAKIRSLSPEGKTRYHFSVQVKLLSKLPQPPIFEGMNLKEDHTIPGTTQDFYQQGGLTLFHGPSFQGIKRVINATSESITVESVWQGIDDKQQGQFPIIQLYNPFVCDLIMQTVWIWLQHFCQENALPAQTNQFEQFRPIPPGEPFYVSALIKSKAATSASTDLIIHDKQGRIYCQMFGAKATVIPVLKLRQK